MIVEKITSDFSEWDEFVLQHPDSRGPHLSNWQRVIENSFGHKCHLLAARENGKIEGILPLTHMNSRIFGSFLISVPYLNYGGIIAYNDKARKALQEFAETLGRKLSVDHIEYRHESTQIQGIPTKQHKVAMLLDLPNDPEVLWKGFKAKLRSQIRKPQKENCTARIGREEELDAFYNVFSINMRDLGTPVYPKKFFRNILKAFPESSWICNIYHNGEAYASGFVFGFRDVMEIPWASSLREHNRIAPNMLLYWSVLEFAIKQNFKRFDFGRSSPEEGTFKFKAQWGAKPVPLNWQYWLANGGAMPDISPKNGKYKLAIQMWQKLPLSITQLMGPSIIKNIP